MIQMSRTFIFQELGPEVRSNGGFRNVAFFEFNLVEQISIVIVVSHAEGVEDAEATRC